MRIYTSVLIGAANGGQDDVGYLISGNREENYKIQKVSSKK